MPLKRGRGSLQKFQAVFSPVAAEADGRVLGPRQDPPRPRARLRALGFAPATTRTTRPCGRRPMACTRSCGPAAPCTGTPVRCPASASAAGCDGPVSSSRGEPQRTAPAPAPRRRTAIASACSRVRSSDQARPPRSPTKVRYPNIVNCLQNFNFMTSHDYDEPTKPHKTNRIHRLRLCSFWRADVRLRQGARRRPEGPGYHGQRSEIEQPLRTGSTLARGGHRRSRKSSCPTVRRRGV